MAADLVPPMKKTLQSAFVIRPATLADAEALSDLTRALLRFERGLSEPTGEVYSWAATPDELRKQINLPTARFFVAVVSDPDGKRRVAAYIKAVIYGRHLTRAELGWLRWLSSRVEQAARRTFTLALRRPRPTVRVETGFISGTFVTPEVRRLGIGRALIAAAEEWLRGQGITTCELRVLWANEDGREFWQAIGYEPLSLGLRKRLDG